MDLIRLDLAIRALRRRRGWRQVDLALAAGVSQTLISLIERGHGDRVSLRTLMGVVAAVDSRLAVQIRWRGGDLDRLLDAGHADVVGALSARLRKLGWLTRIEVTYATPGASGSIDMLAWHAPTRSLLVIEVKTEITSAEATLRKLDEKGRLAGAIARDRFGWASAAVSRLLVIEDTSTARRRVGAHLELFDAALPITSGDLRCWLAQPTVAIAGRLFLSPSNGRAGIQAGGGRHRVRRARNDGDRPGLSVRPDGVWQARALDDPRRTLLIG